MNIKGHEVRVIEDIKQWQTLREQLNPSIGLVATMGNLHRGHLSLIERSRRENELTVVTIYTNPTQFDNPDDFANYPKTLKQDIALLNQCQVDYCLLPNYPQIYPNDYRYQIHETELSTIMEGAHRPGHFNGMLTIVMKLLNLIQARNAYFGEKDYQQYLLIKAMVTSFFMPVTVTACPTVRESSGLALSSRNKRLSLKQRTQAEQFARLFLQGKNCQEIQTQLIQSGTDVDYIEEHHSRRFAAVRIGEVRLIDNYPLMR